MKWYSIKEHTPPAGTDVIVRIIKEGGFIYDRFFIAMTEDFATIEDFATWDLSGVTLDYIDTKKYKVTHFALIEPVPIWRGE